VISAEEVEYRRRLHNVEAVLAGCPFTGRFRQFRLYGGLIRHSLGLMGGSHKFQVYRIDATGYINPVGEPVQREILAPTIAATETPVETQSPTATPTATASWGEIIDVPWFENDPLDSAESGVSPITVGKIVIGVGIPIGIILVAAFAFLLSKYRRAVREDMDQRLNSSSASEAGATGMGV
jgi:hypothetical protein